MLSILKERNPISIGKSQSKENLFVFCASANGFFVGVVNGFSFFLSLFQSFFHSVFLSFFPLFLFLSFYLSFFLCPFSSMFLFYSLIFILFLSLSAFVLGLSLFLFVFLLLFYVNLLFSFSSFLSSIFLWVFNSPLTIVLIKSFFICQFFPFTNTPFLCPIGSFFLFFSPCLFVSPFKHLYYVFKL